MAPLALALLCSLPLLAARGGKQASPDVAPAANPAGDTAVDPTAPSDRDPILEALRRAEAQAALAEAAAQPLPAILVEIPDAAGVPEQSCSDALAEAEALRRTREEPLPPQPLDLDALGLEPPTLEPRTGEAPDDGVEGRPRIKVNEATLADSGLPGTEPDALPLQPLEGTDEARRRVGDVLRSAALGQRVRITAFGASHTGGDFWTGHLRRLLQARYGDLGHGFILPGALYRGYRGQDINLCRTDGWRPDWVGKKRGRDDGFYGFGASVGAHDPAELGWLETTSENEQGRAVSRYELYTLGEPAAGTLVVQVDEAEPQEIVNRREEVGILRHRVEVPDGPHRLTLRPRGDGEVRIFGVSAEREGPGVIVDAIGIRGRTARTWLAWDPESSARAVASLAPDMVVLAYGTNEANDLLLTPDVYRDELRQVLTRMRRAAPAAACVLAGPSDRGKKISRDTYVVWDRTAWVARVQREVAREFDCVFWDWQQATGGEGSMIAWSLLEPRLAARDLIHFTPAGYEWSAERFLMAMEDAALQTGGLPGENLVEDWKLEQAKRAVEQGR